MYADMCSSVSTRSKSTIRRVVIDSEYVVRNTDTGAGQFTCHLPEELVFVESVQVVELMVKSKPIGGVVTFEMNTSAGESSYTVDIPNGSYDADFKVFEDAFVDAVNTSAMKASLTTSLIYDTSLRTFVIRITNVDVYSVTITLSNSVLASALAWPQSFSVEGDGASPGLQVRLPPISAYNWPLVHEPVYVTIDQLSSSHQGACGYVLQLHTTGVTEPTLERLTGVDTALAYAVPSHEFRTIQAFSHARPVHVTPISRLRRLDIRVRTANGAVYNTPRVIMMLDITQSQSYA